MIEEFTAAGLSEECQQRTNLVTIVHDDGTSEQYAHQVQNGVTVAVGDYVETGELISYSGDVGYSSSPHLHFHVYHHTGFPWVIETMPTVFHSAEGQSLSLVEGSATPR